VSKTAWLGFLFLVALILLGFTTLVLKDLPGLFGERYELRVHFDRVRGLKEGDDVRVEGLLFGKVERLALHPDHGVVATLRLERGVTLYRDARVVVESSSALGGSYVSIQRGTEGAPLDTSQLIPGAAQAGFEAIGGMVEENRENFRELVKNLKEVTQALREGQGSAGKFLRSDELHRQAVTTLEEVRKVAEKAQERLSSEFVDATLFNVSEAAENLKDATALLKKGEGPLGALLADKTMTEKLNKTLDNVEASSKNLKEISDTIRKGEGTLGKLVTDKEMGERLQRTVENIEKSSESIRNITGRLENGEGSVGKLLQDDELYEKAKQTLDDIDKVFAKAARAVVEVVGDSKLYDDTEVQISRLGIRISPSEDKFFYVGAAFMSLNREGDILFKNLVEDNESGTEIKGEVQVGYRIPWILDRRLTLRAGLLEGKPGGGVEFLWDDWLLFTHPVQFVFEGRDAYNDVDDEDIDEELDGPLLRLYVRTPLWTRKENWFELLLTSIRLYAGVSRLGENGEAMVGIGLEWPDDDIRTLVSFIGLAR
jgi:phospholipid/cholesterol/gamma-HCH transport system substrate-binding protein